MVLKDVLEKTTQKLSVPITPDRFCQPKAKREVFGYYAPWRMWSAARIIGQDPRDLARKFAGNALERSSARIIGRDPHGLAREFLRTSMDDLVVTKLRNEDILEVTGDWKKFKRVYFIVKSINFDSYGAGRLELIRLADDRDLTPVFERLRGGGNPAVQNRTSDPARGRAES